LIDSDRNDIIEMIIYHLRINFEPMLSLETTLAIFTKCAYDGVGLVYHILFSRKN